MDIEDAFVQEAWDAADTNLDTEDQAAIRAMAEEIYNSNGVELTDYHATVAGVFFVAGRTYQAGQPVRFPMSPRLARAFMEFLAERGSDA